MAQFNLAALLTHAGRRMGIDLRENLTRHPGELGSAREEVVRQFLREYLPKRFAIGTGFIFDSAGRLSEQMDIVILDSVVAPTFKASGGTSYYPCECVVAAGQIRSSLTSRSDLRVALNNLESAKRLDRSANNRAFDHVYSEQLAPLENYLHQMFTFVFVTGKAMAPDTMREEVLSWVLEREPHLWPNVLIALDQLLITYCCLDGVCPNNMHARGLALQTPETDGDLLLRFYLFLGAAVQVTRVSGLPYWEYLTAAKQWRASVVHSTNDVPPPLLSQSCVPHAAPGGP